MCSNHCRSHFTDCKVKVPSSSKIMTSLFPSPKYLSSYCKLSLLDQNHYNLVTVNCPYLTLRISSCAKMGTICHHCCISVTELLCNSVFSGVDDVHRESVFFCHTLCIWVVCRATGTLSLNVHKAIQLKSFILQPYYYKLLRN